MSDDRDIDNRPSAIATAEDLARAREVSELQRKLHDEFLPKVDRAIAAELAGQAWDAAGLVGVDVPPQIKKIVDGFAFFGPMLKYVAGYNDLPEWVRKGFENVLEGADLARRTID